MLLELFCFAFLRVIWQFKQLEYKPVTLFFSFRKNLATNFGISKSPAHGRLLRLNRLYLQLRKQEGDLRMPCHEVRGDETYAYTSHPLWNLTFFSHARQPSFIFMQGPILF